MDRNRRHLWLGIVLTFALMTLIGGTVEATPRVALVIGNGAYAHVPDLANTSHDAEDMAAALTRLDFAVTHLKDLSGQAMRRALRDFSRKAYGADMALVFFAGHGIEVNKQNYLVPVDAQLRSNLDIEYEAIPLDRVMSAVRGAKGLRLVLLDACRNNPFLAEIDNADGSRSIGRGLARVEPQVGTLVGYAAKEGTTAADGKGRNSPYTKALLAQPGLEINFLFRKVRDSVINETGGRQEPFTYGSLPGKRLFLKAPEADKPKLSKAERDRIAWAQVKDSNSVGVLKHFVTRNPDNLFANHAHRRIEALEEIAQAERRRLRAQIAWNVVKDTGNLTLLRNYVAEFPNSRFADNAKARIAALETEAAWKRKADQSARQAAITAAWQHASNSSDPAVLEAFATQYSGSTFASEARARAAQLRQRNKVAALQPQSHEPDAEEPVQSTAEEPKLDKRQLALAVQKELNRVGCNAGRPDGKWGRGSRRALQGFARHAKLKLASLTPNEDMLDTLIRHKSRVCPLTCSPRQIAKGDRCIVKTCGRGKELDRRGRCIAKRDDAKKRKDKREKNKRERPKKQVAKKVPEKRQVRKKSAKSKCSRKELQRWKGQAFFVPRCKQ